MRLNSKYFIFITITLLLIQCTPSTKVINTNSSTPINGNITEQQQAVDLIAPYKQQLDAEMNEVLVISSEEFPKEKGKAQTKLGNLVADLSLEVAQKMYADTIDFCLLNFGGLRTSLPKGEITRGKIFELMPFENELVVVSIDEAKMKEITAYLKKIGGQPISGKFTAHYNIHKKKLKTGNVLVTDSTWYQQNRNSMIPKNEIRVLTSDYLANGGDNMNFFLNPLKTEKIGIKLRDAIIQYCIEQNKQGKQLVGKLDDRIIIEK